MTDFTSQIARTEVATPSRRRLFLAFLRLGLTAFGGPTMVAYIRDLAVRKKQWLSDESFQNGAALCQSIPGATAMQTAAYVGLRAGGPWGALASFVGFGLPAFLLMLVLSAIYERTHELQAVMSAFRGLQVIVIALMANAALDFGRRTIGDWRDALLTVGAALFLGFHGSPIIAIAAAAALGVLICRGPNPNSVPASGAGNEMVCRNWTVVAGIVLAIAAGFLALFSLAARLFDLSTLMMKVDLFAFGGGFASVPLMMHEVVDKRQWMDARTFMDGIALGQVTPGPIVITATFVGYQVAGVLGAIAGTVGIFAPSFLMVLIAVPFIDRLQYSVWFRRALRGVLASFIGLLLAVTVHFGMAAQWSVPAVVLVVAAFTALRFKLDILWVVLIGAAISVFVL
jgi:chromate transporter